mmetsp:Transcript_22710/g.64387  ORF Transcript_22710/g.64387 Transcript_22710/m.64387 type:complete len:382 (-) Transcript_22710:121-1266(-)
MQAVARRCSVLALLALAAHGPVRAMRQPARGLHPEAAKVSDTTGATNHSAKATGEDVKHLREKLEVVLSGLKGMVNGKNGTLAKAKVAPAMQVFVDELETVLVNTSSMKDPVVAMAKLKDASAGLKTLVHELTARQEALMLEDESQQESLLLGVLMSKQQDSMDTQRKVLQSLDFANLPVSKTLLAANNTTAALYVQAAEFLDAHRGKQMVAVLKEKVVAHAAGAEKLAVSLEKRVQSMERELRAKEASYKKRSQLLAQRAKSTSSKKERHLAETLMKREVHNFKKFAAVRSRDIASMKSAVEAVRRGDVKALQSARAALLASLQALKSQNGGFLVLLSIGHRAMGGDCPYCAAQCIDKCRQLGNSYVKCLGDCADAGKSF